jgi:hypothetical protein
MLLRIDSSFSEGIPGRSRHSFAAVLNHFTPKSPTKNRLDTNLYLEVSMQIVRRALLTICCFNEGK